MKVTKTYREFSKIKRKPRDDEKWTQMKQNA